MHSCTHMQDSVGPWSRYELAVPERCEDFSRREAVKEMVILMELLLGGFFAVGCIAAHGPFPAGKRITFGEFFRLPGRWERLRRSRWQWFAMVALVLVLRLQSTLPLILELTVLLQLLVFLALPARREAVAGVRSR